MEKIAVQTEISEYCLLTSHVHIRPRVRGEEQTHRLRFFCSILNCIYTNLRGLFPILNKGILRLWPIADPPPTALFRFLADCREIQSSWTLCSSNFNPFCAGSPAPWLAFPAVVVTHASLLIILY